MINTTAALAFAAALLIIGVYCLSVKRNMIKMILGVEIMTNGAIMAFVIFATSNGLVDPIAHALSILAISVGGCIAAVALSITVQAYRHFKTLDVRELRRLKW
jgi:multicomponent Na+:H+ antiporter subunit C